MQPRINLLTLGVSDLHASIAFYRDTLGLPYSARSVENNVAFFALDGTWLGLFPTTDLAKDAGVSSAHSGFRAVTVSQNLPSAAEVDALFAELKEKGVTIVKPPQTADWGGHSGYFEDPDGHLWEVAYNPYFTPGQKSE